MASLKLLLIVFATAIFSVGCGEQKGDKGMGIPVSFLPDSFKKDSGDPSKNAKRNEDSGQSGEGTPSGGAAKPDLTGGGSGADDEESSDDEELDEEESSDTTATGSSGASPAGETQEVEEAEGSGEAGSAGSGAGISSASGSSGGAAKPTTEESSSSSSSTAAAKGESSSSSSSSATAAEESSSSSSSAAATGESSSSDESSDAQAPAAEESSSSSAQGAATDSGSSSASADGDDEEDENEIDIEDIELNVEIKPEHLKEIKRFLHKEHVEPSSGDYVNQALQVSLEKVQVGKVKFNDPHNGAEITEFGMGFQLGLGDQEKIDLEFLVDMPFQVGKPVGEGQTNENTNFIGGYKMASSAIRCIDKDCKEVILQIELMITYDGSVHKEIYGAGDANTGKVENFQKVAEASLVFKIADDYKSGTLSKCHIRTDQFLSNRVAPVGAQIAEQMLKLQEFPVDHCSSLDNIFEKLSK